ncbi:MAG: hypothetical protein AB8C13_10465 [Phycisphaerales bacterium]
MQHGPSTPTASTPEPTQSGTDQGVQTSLDTLQPDAGEGEVGEPVAGKSVAEESNGQQSIQDSTLEQESPSFFESLTAGQEMGFGPSMLFLGGIVLALLVTMRMLMRSSSKRKLQTHTMGQPSERIDKINTRASGSMDPARKVMVEAEELTRRLGAVLDNKAAKIEVLLEEANQRITQLERASAQSLAHAQQANTPRSANQTNSSSSSNSSGVSPEALDRARLDQDRADRQWVQDTHPASGPPQRTADENSPATPTFRIDRGPAAKGVPETPNPLTFPDQVDELVTRGFNALEIANKLNRPIGEVELILNLRRNSG